MPDEKPKRGSVTPSGNAFGNRPTNWLMPMMLLSIREWDSYGYELMERARALGFETMNPGTFTGRSGRWRRTASSSRAGRRQGPARRMYTITDAGEAYLGFWAKSLGQYRQSMDAFFRLYESKPPHTGKN